ncbi:olfactory receptor 56B34-like [Ambystoma mexicanum]|uniref:olfactory receptor 56B34-like n=1 Tax=Ambystoma mexicanum TaxID=8296 RepID=UPI0037E8BF41
MCFAQIYIINSMFTIQSGLFMVMAYDRYIAICKPLQYPLIISDHYLLKACSVAIVGGLVVCLPMVVLTSELNYCDRNLIGQCFCETLKVANLACVRNNVINMYVFVIVWFTTGFDMVLISFSYCMIVRAVLRLQSKEAASKTFSTCASHLVVICYYYSSVVILVITSVMGEKIISEVHTLLAILFSLIPPALNPVVYGLRTTEIRAKIFSMIKKS